MRVWSRITLLLLLGYSLLGRSFAYLGLPSLKVFIGEVFLAAFAFLRPRELFGVWVSWLIGRGQHLVLGWLLLAHLLWGLILFLRGYWLGHDTLVAMQNLVFNIYPLYLFVGYWIGRKQPGFFGQFFFLLALLNSAYGLAYLFVLNRLGAYFPWAPDVPIFGQPPFSQVAIFGLLALFKLGVVSSLLLAMNLFVMLGMQVRGEWLGFTVGLVFWGLLFRRSRRALFMVSLLIALIIVVLWFLDVRLAAPETRGGEISVRGIVGRLLAPLNPDVAAEFVGEEAYAFAGTVVGWRIPWWSNIWQEVHSQIFTAVWGLGYGYPLWTLTSSTLEIIPEGVRTPHNVFFYALAYGGWIGVLLFFSFLTSIAYSLLSAFRNKRQPEVGLSLVLLASLFFSGLFGNLFETPFGAIPFYLIVGLGLGAAEYANSRASHSLPTAGR